MPWIVACLGVAACGSDPVALRRQQQEYVVYDREVAQKARARVAALEGLDRIVYPPCPAVTDGDRVSRCGRSLFEISMRECRRRATVVAGPGAVPIASVDPADGGRSGSDSASDVDRLRLIDVAGAGGPHTERVAITSGGANGTTVVLTCSIGADMHLTDVS